MSDHTCPRFFDLDLVKYSEHSGKSGPKCGMVVSCYQEDYNSDSEDGDPNSAMRGEVTVMWASLHPCRMELTETELEKDLVLVDRALITGDGVRHLINGKDTQRGVVQKLYVHCDLQVIGTRIRLKNVSRRNLIPIEPYAAGLYCSYKGLWLGEIAFTREQILLQFRNGSKCLVPGKVARHFCDYYESHNNEWVYYTEFFYASQCLCGPYAALKDAVWLSGHAPSHPQNGNFRAIVDLVLTTMVGVNWICCGYNANNQSGEGEDPPSSRLQITDLPHLKVLKENSHIQLGEQFVYKLTEADMASQKSKSNFVKMVASSKQKLCSRQLSKPRPRKMFSHALISSDQKTKSRTEPHAGRTSQSRISTARCPEQSQECDDSVRVFGSEAPISCSLLDNRPQTDDLRKSDDEMENLDSMVNEDENMWVGGEEEESRAEADDIEGGELNDLVGNEEVAVEDGEPSTIPFDQSLSTLSGLDEELTEEQRKKELEKSLIVQTAEETISRKKQSSPGFVSDSDESLQGLEREVSTVSVYRKISSRCSSRSYTPDEPVNRRRRLKLQVDAGQTVGVKVMKTRTVADVQWQDGSFEFGTPAHQLYPTHHLDELEFFPGDYVHDKRDDASADLYGIVVKANHHQRTCLVNWCSNASNDRGCKISEEHLSVFNIEDHPSMSFNIGDLVIRLADSNETGATDLGCAGHVVKMVGDGEMLVEWDTGNISSVPPQDVLNYDQTEDMPRVNPESEDDSEQTDESESEGDSEWETASSLDECEEVEEDESDVCETEAERAEVADKMPKERPKSLRMKKRRSSIPHTPRTPTSPLISPMVTTTHDGFTQLDSTPDTHVFANVPCVPINQKVFLHCIRKELALLRTSLPEGIIVKGFDDRMDLFSAMIAGPVNTPYEDGLFFFDIQLLEDYPDSPPSFHYISYCAGKLNPNLYEEGKVCVSLLGTWVGKGTEKWTKKSSLLQVLISIQGLILNKEPYFNEAGYDRQRETQQGLENSRMFNETAIIKVIQSLIKQVKNVPESFKDEVACHIRNCSSRLLRRLTSWIAIGSAMNRDRTSIAEADGPTPAECALNTSPVHGASVPSYSPSTANNNMPEFSLFPLSQGFMISLQEVLGKFKSVVEPPKFEIPD